MTDTLEYQHKGPKLFPMYAKAAIIPKGSASGKSRKDIQIPELTAKLTGVQTNLEALRAYRKLCGFETSTQMPATWPQLEAFSLHIRLMTDPKFPLPLLGMVHLRNVITQHRPIHEGECLDITCTTGGSKRTDKGLEFEMLTNIESGGRLVWEGVSTMLFRMPSEGGSKPKKVPEPPKPLTHEQGIHAAADTGRRSGKVSGDINPIHMNSLSARLFGFPKAIAHGMWSKAQCLSAMQRRPDFRNGAFRIEANFKKPLFLPGTASLSWDEDGKEWPFKLLNAKATAPHLDGRIQFLD